MSALIASALLLNEQLVASVFENTFRTSPAAHVGTVIHHKASALDAVQLAHAIMCEN